MSIWSQLFLQESFSSNVQLLSLFHDYSLSIILFILSFVACVSFSLLTNNLLSFSVIVTIVEVVWTVIPVIILLFLVVPSLQILYLMEESDPYLSINVVGHQWYWSYQISDLDLDFDSYIRSVSEVGDFRLLDVDHRVVLPVGNELRALVSAADVLHCWAVPGLGLKVDAVPGRLNQVYFNVLRSSLLYGQCSEICGANHSFMPISVEGLSAERFLNWCSIR